VHVLAGSISSCPLSTFQFEVLAKQEGILGTNGRESQLSGALPARIRAVCVAAGCVSALASLAVGGFVYAIPLVAATLIQPRLPRPGRRLIWLSAAFLTLIMVPMSVVLIPEALKTPLNRHYSFSLLMFALWVLSPLLITWCDLELLIDAVGTRRERRTTDQPHPAFAGNWLMWIVAVVLNWFFFPGVASDLRFYRLHHYMDILLLHLGMDLVVILFDAALLLDIAKMLRARLTKNKQA